MLKNENILEQIGTGIFNIFTGICEIGLGIAGAALWVFVEVVSPIIVACAFVGSVINIFEGKGDANDFLFISCATCMWSGNSGGMWDLLAGSFSLIEEGFSRLWSPLEYGKEQPRDPLEGIHSFNPGM